MASSIHRPGMSRKTIRAATACQIEQLETRLLFSSYTVTTLGESAGIVTPVGIGKFNATTLRAAITAANSHGGADTITFAPAVVGIINLSSALPAISDSLTLTGPGPSNLTVQRSAMAATSFSVLQFNAGITATISGLTIAGGTGTIFPSTRGDPVADGGGILNSGTLSATNCTLSGNSTQGGGGIFNLGKLTLTACTISGNVAEYEGGGVMNDAGGTATLTGCTLFDNSTVGIGGGGITNYGTLTLNSSVLAGNVATVGASGGGIANRGILTVNGSTISNNSSFGSDGGGGIDNFGSVSVSSSVISDNSAEEQNGGGIANDDGATVTLTTCTVSGNSSLGVAGGILNSGSLTLTACTLSDSISGEAAGLSNQSTGIASLSDCTVAANMADGVGGIDNAGSLTLINGTISANTGGGVSSDGTLWLVNTIVAGNTGSNAFIDVPNDITGTVSPSSADNLIGTGGSGSLVNGQNHNLVGIAPAQLKLGALADNGGPTQTMALLSGSVAIDAGSNSLAIGPDGKPLATDQRGLPRISGTAVDIGAFEVQVAPKVVGFSLLDALIGNSLGTLTDGQTVSLSKLGTKHLDVQAVTGGGSVTFSLNGKYVGFDTFAPFTLLGAQNKPSGGLAPGTYTLTIQSFSQTYARGVAGAFTTIHFKVVA